MRAALRGISEFTGETHGRDLAQGTHGDEILEKIPVPQDHRMPFRVSGDGRDACHLEAEDFFFDAGRD